MRGSLYRTEDRRGEGSIVDRSDIEIGERRVTDLVV
jgi:hypothetical protein